MSRAWLVTLTHIDIPLLEQSLEQIRLTTARREYEKHVLVDHHWPIAPWIHRRELLGLAERFDCKLITPYENMGGARGINWAIANIPMHDSDIFIGVDADSFPQTPGWVTAMKTVLSDSVYGSVSLRLNIDLNTKVWDEENVHGLRVMRPCANGIDMINVTGWRVGAFRKVGGFTGGLPFYGGVEIPVFLELRAAGWRHGYLKDFHENMKPFEPHEEYRKWKAAHVAGTFPGNFCEWVKEKGIYA